MSNTPPQYNHILYYNYRQLSITKEPSASAGTQDTPLASEQETHSKPGLLKRTALLSAIVCLTQAAGSAASFAADDYTPNTDESSAEASGFHGTVPEKEYKNIYGGYAAHKDPAIAGSNILDLTAKHSAESVWGGYAERKDGSAAATSNIVNFSGGTVTNSVCGGEALGGSSASGTGNAVKITDVNFAGNTKILGGGKATAEKDNGSAHADRNSLTAAYAEDTNIDWVYGGYAQTSGYGSATASYNGSQGNSSDGTLTNVFIGDFKGGIAVAHNGGTAEANHNCFSLNVSMGDVMGDPALVFKKSIYGQDVKSIISNGNISGGCALAVWGTAPDSTLQQPLKSIADASYNTLSINESMETFNYNYWWGEIDGGTAYASGAADTQNTFCQAAADSNTLIITEVAGLHDNISVVRGGYASIRNAAANSSASASGNVLIINGSLVRLDPIFFDSDYSPVYDLETEHMMDADIEISSFIYGGVATGYDGTVTANYNGQGINQDKVSTLTNVVAWEFCGGRAGSEKGSAEASYNKFTIKGGVYGSLVAGHPAGIGGGYASAGYSATADGNALTLYDTFVRSYIYGGVATVGAINGTDGKAKASGNTLTLVNTTVKGYPRLAGNNYKSAVYGGIAAVVEGGTAVVEGGTAQASNNRIDIYGGSYNVYKSAWYSIPIYAGYSYGGERDAVSATDNTVALYAYKTADEEKMPQLDNTVLWGGCTEGAAKGTVSGNTLEFHNVQGLKASNIKNFDTLAFELPDMKAGETVLTVTGNYAIVLTITLPDYKQRIKDEQTVLGTGNGSVVDVQSIGELTGADGGEFKVGDKVYLLKNSNGIVADKAVLKTVNYQVGATIAHPMAVQKDDTSIYLTRTGDAVVLPGAKAVAEGAAAGLALANEAANASLEFARTFSPEKGVAAPFVYVHGSSAQYETGSTVSLNAVSLMAGIGAGLETGAGKLSAGAFFEYGKGSYTTSNSFDNAADINGDGSSWYMGGGIIAKMEFLSTGPGHFYAEGSAHMGQLHNEYDSSDLCDKYGRGTGFDMDSPYYALHGGLGYVWDITDEHELDVYGKYIWTRVQGTDETLTTGDKFEFDDIDSSRVRLGARYTYKGNERFRPYVGAAWEHEFAGSCDSKTYGHNVSAPSFEGDTGIGELGITLSPSDALPLSINLGVQGYVGQKRGISGSCLVKYEF